MTEQLPVFATNRVAPEMTVAEELQRLFRVNREALQVAPSAAIATAYVNPGGFLLLADELEQMPRIRLLLGAEPIPDPLQRDPHDAASADRLAAALQDHEHWLKAERDALGFELQSTRDARRLVAWLRAANERGEPVVEIRRYTGGFLHGKAFISLHPTHPAYLAGSSNLTVAGLTRNAELNVGASGQHGSTQQVIDWFEDCWAESEPFDLAAIYEPLWAEHTPWTVFLRMLLSRYGEHLEEEAAVQTGMELTRFQADGVRRMERLLEQLGGVLVADEVGLGKTYLALSVIRKATTELGQRVMVIAPAALKYSVWEKLFSQYGYSRWVTTYSFEEVRSRMDPEHPQHKNFLIEAEDAALIVVDEAHNLRNSAAARSAAVDRVILSGKLQKKVVLLTATPVNNSLIDLETLVRYFVRNDAQFASEGIPSIREYIRTAQTIDPEALTPAHLFDLMDQISVRRTRTFVKENYRGDSFRSADGTTVQIEFPEPDVRRVDYELDDAGTALVNAVTYALDIPEKEEHVASFTVRRDDPDRLLLARYVPSQYELGKKLRGNEVNNQGLLRAALLKRLESSPAALLGTLRVLETAHVAFLKALDEGVVLTGRALRDFAASESEDLDEILEGLDDRSAGQALDAAGYNVRQLHADVEHDLALIRRLVEIAQEAVAQSEPKVEALLKELARIARESTLPAPVRASERDRRKVIVFSTFADTIRDLHRRVAEALEQASDDSPLALYRGRLAPPISGESVTGARGGVEQTGRANVVAHFAPRTAGTRRDDGSLDEDLFDLLLTTDVLAEGVNLQQAAHIVNYDLPWNPMRIVQRHGRVDRIGSEHSTIELDVFFPAEHLDQFLGLEQTLVRKLRQADAAVGAGKVLPGVSHYPPRNHYDADEIVDEIEALVESGGGSAAGSGEEYRRRLFDALERDTGLRARLEDLPLAIGSGFVNPNVSQSAYVFCMQMGDSGQTWFRNVNVDAQWQPVTDEHERVIVDDTLVSLVTADPGRPDRERDLSDAAFMNAYEAWALASQDAYNEWMRSTDPNQMMSARPASFREASQFVRDHGAALGEAQVTVLRRLNTVPAHKARIAMRRVMNETMDAADRLQAIVAVLDEHGIQPAEAVKPLPKIAKEDIRLVAWMAVQGGKVVPEETVDR